MFVEVAQEVFNRCITERKQDKEGSTQSLNDRYEVVMNYEFLDDMYTIDTWRKKTKRRQDRKISKLKFFYF